MTTRQKLTAIRKMIGGSQPEDKFDSLVLSALMDEISGRAPEGHADEVERRLHARTGYTFPHSAEMKELADSAKDGAEHVRRLRDGS